MKKILIIDDEENLCHFVKVVLEDSGKYEVHTENNPANALSAVTEFRPDLIILDVLMPDIDGGEVEVLLKRADISKDIPIIFLTAMASKLDPNNKGVDVAGRFIIAKPVNVKNLITAIEEKLEKE